MGKKGAERIFSDHCSIIMKINWMIKVDEKEKTKIAVTKKNIRQFKNKTSGEELQKIWKDQTKTTAEKYTKWSDRVAEIGIQTMKWKKKKRMESKKMSQIRRKKKLVKKQMNQETDEQRKEVLKNRYQIMNDRIINQMKEENYKITMEIAKKIKQENGINRNNFWEYKRKTSGRKETIMHDVMDMEGKMVTEPDRIKETYLEYYKDLLGNKIMITEEEKEIEKMVEKMMMIIGKKSRGREINVNKGEIKDVVKTLKKRKAGDREGWRNEMVTEGGSDMERSLEMMITEVMKNRIVPSEWERLRINSVHKKGSKKDLENQRGLFLTNIVSKIVERIINNKNKERVMKTISPFQCGGKKNRSSSDNLFMLNSIIQYFKIKKENLYILFTDLKKCFDKLWLEDAISELVLNGMNKEEAEYLYRMNKKVKVIVSTPAGETEEFILTDIVKQGTVLGPLMAGVSVDRINRMADETYLDYYDVTIKYPAFVDDVIGMGTKETIEKMNGKMQILETRKKFDYNTKTGKTNYMIMRNKKEDDGEVKLCVGRGNIEKIDRYKYLGDEYDEKGSNPTKIEGRMAKLRYMANEARQQGSYHKVGNSDMQVRKILIEATIIHSVLANTETWTELKENEYELMDRHQGKLLRIVLEMPKGTPYYGMIGETGMWPFSAIVWYKEMMWWRTLIRSDEDRVARKMLLKQIENDDESWAKQVKRKAEELEINLETANIMKKSKEKFKKEVKEKIRMNIEKKIQDEARQKTKMRNLIDEKFEEKEYMKKCSAQQCKEIMKIRLNMIQTKANFKNKDGDCKCPAGCTEEETTEHMITCPKLDELTGKVKVTNIHKDLKNSTWLKTNVKQIMMRQKIRSLVYDN